MRKFLPSDTAHAVFTTNMDPVAAHVAHIRHLSRISGLVPILIANHDVSAAEATKRAEEIVPYIQQGLHFHAAALQAPPRVRPVLRYYAYTNLAKAVVLLYQPSGYSAAVGRHGASDTTHELSTLDLNSEVLKVAPGVIPLFHSLVGWSTVKDGQRLSLKQLLVAIPPVGGELGEFYGIGVEAVEVVPNLGGLNSSIASRFDFRIWGQDRRTPGTGNLVDAINMLHADANYDLQMGGQPFLLSKTRWDRADAETAERNHQQGAQRLINLGGQHFDNARLKYVWRWASRVSILPTLSASLMLSFVLSSLYRYRAGLLDRIEGSEISLILEIFDGESDGIMLPGLRHLLFARPLFMSRLEFV